MRPRERLHGQGPACHRRTRHMGGRTRADPRSYARHGGLSVHAHCPGFRAAGALLGTWVSEPRCLDAGTADQVAGIFPQGRSHALQTSVSAIVSAARPCCLSRFSTRCQRPVPRNRPQPFRTRVRRRSPPQRAITRHPRRQRTPRRGTRRLRPQSSRPAPCRLVKRRRRHR